MDWTLHGGKHSELALLVITVTLAFMIYWFTVEHQGIRSHLKMRFTARAGALAWFIGNKLTGTVLFGLAVPAVMVLLFPEMSLAASGFALPVDGTSWTLALVLTAVLASVSWIKNKRIHATGGDFGRYPEIEAEKWTWRTVMLDVLFWMLYLLAYEYMFRGVLLFTCAASLGFPVAVGLNVALYALAHVPKGAQEAFGALVLGYVLCVLTFASSSILFAWMIHCALAIANDLSAWYYRPDMRFTRRRVGK